MFHDKFNRAYLSILKEQVEDQTEETTEETSEETSEKTGACPICGNDPCTCETCPECGNNPCTCMCSFKNFQELVEKFSEDVSKEGLIQLLNIAVNDELLATYNYLASYTLCKTEGKVDFDPEFQAHEKEEYDHAHLLINRLRQLNANVLITPWCDITKCNSAGEEWAQETDANSIEILTRRYQEEIAAIEFYGFVLGYIKELAKGNESEYDSTTHQLIKKIKADEEEHALDLRDLLTEFGVEISDDLNPEASTFGDEDDETEDLDEDEDEDEDAEDLDEDEDEDEETKETEEETDEEKD